MNTRVFEFEEWRDCMVPYLAPGFLDEASAEAACRAFMSQCMAKMKEEGAIEDLGWDNEGDDAAHEELCNCRFSLAYGGKILLNNACLRLVSSTLGESRPLVALQLASITLLQHAIRSTDRSLPTCSSAAAATACAAPTAPASPPSCAPSAAASWTASPPPTSSRRSTWSTTSRCGRRALRFLLEGGLMP
jgi:hypothetical protein